MRDEINYYLQLSSPAVLEPIKLQGCITFESPNWTNCCLPATSTQTDPTSRLELVADPVTQAIRGSEFEDGLMPGSPGDVLSD